jgi:hypothetical protein
VKIQKTDSPIQTRFLVTETLDNIGLIRDHGILPLNATDTKISRNPLGRTTESFVSKVREFCCKEPFVVISIFCLQSVLLSPPFFLSAPSLNDLPTRFLLTLYLEP